MLRTCLAAVVLLSLPLLFAACSQQEGTAPPQGTPPPSRDISLEADLARGGRLYDKWYQVIGAPAPTTAHAAYPGDAGYADKPDANWRCKECHGWDYAGKDGAYASGSHATGIGGVLGKSGAGEAEIAATLRDETHGFGDVLGAEELRQLALFIRAGTMDMDSVIDRTSAKADGDAERGRVYYATICAGCHGAEGIAEDMPVLGAVSVKNPWETLHKILNGQPGSTMPALRALDLSISVDVLAYLQTLPAK